MSAILDPTGLSGKDTKADLELAPRRAELSGARVGLLENGKQNASLFLTEVADILRERYGAGEARLRRKENFAQPGATGADRRAQRGVGPGGDRDWRLRLVQRVGGRRRSPFRASRHTGSGDLLGRIQGHRDAMAEIQGAPGYVYADHSAPGRGADAGQVRERAEAVADEVARLLGAGGQAREVA